MAAKPNKGGGGAPDQTPRPVRGTDLRARLEALGAGPSPLRPGQIRPMLAETRTRPFSGKDWIFELKYDGFRLIVARQGGEPCLLYRRGAEVTSTFPEIAGAVRALPFEAIMDGEVVILDEAGRPSFQRMQRRAQLTRPIDVERAAIALPATAFLFDLLWLDGHDLRALPLVARKQILREILREVPPSVGPLRFTDHVEDRGEDLYAEIGRMKLEGMVAKKKASPYREGRSEDWLKIRHDTTGDFAIVGFTEPKGSRSAIGALHLAARGEDGLRYAGKVGTGLDDRMLRDLRAKLAGRERAKPPCSGSAPTGRAHVWVEPLLVCEVRYKQWTEDGSLRQAVFLRLRDDKAIEDLADEGRDDHTSTSSATPRTIHFTNLDKVFWPEECYTKGDLIEFYRTIAPWLLPYLADRPLVLTRFPDGIDGKSFYQKDAPGFVPNWIRTERVWSEHAGREIDYFVCDDVESLVYLVNLGTIPLHLWSSRVGRLDRPDWCIIDLDPKGAPFADVVTLARATHRLCDAIELPSFVKTSGATGLHVLVPLGGQLTHDESRTLGELIARVVNSELPEISTIVRKVGDRGGRVYLDFLQNRHGQTIAGPYSARPLPGAPVSTPLRWSEVGRRLDPRRFTIRSLHERLASQAEDPLRPVLTLCSDLGRALERLAARVERAAQSGG